MGSFDPATYDHKLRPSRLPSRSAQWWTEGSDSLLTPRTFLSRASRNSPVQSLEEEGTRKITSWPKLCSANMKTAHTIHQPQLENPQERHTSHGRGRCLVADFSRTNNTMMSNCPGLPNSWLPVRSQATNMGMITYRHMIHHADVGLYAMHAVLRCVMCWTMWHARRWCAMALNVIVV